jgi:hypothetical protein
LSKLYKSRAYKFTDYHFARILYEVALISYRQKGFTLFENLLSTAISLDPTLSYWHVELANYFYSEGRFGEADKILIKCQTLPEPANHCKNFEEYMENSLSPLKVGFLLSETEKYYNIKSIMKPSYFVN